MPSRAAAHTPASQIVTNRHADLDIAFHHHFGMLSVDNEGLRFEVSVARGEVSHHATDWDGFVASHERHHGVRDAQIHQPQHLAAVRRNAARPVHWLHRAASAPLCNILTGYRCQVPRCRRSHSVDQPQPARTPRCEKRCGTFPTLRSSRHSAGLPWLSVVIQGNRSCSGSRDTMRLRCGFIFRGGQVERR